MRTNYYCFWLIISTLFLSTTTYSQTANFDETWKEFLENNKISNMSELIRPDKVFNQPDYAKYLLMNINSSFCQSEVEKAEKLMAEVKAIDADVYTSIPSFLKKKEDLAAKIKAYHLIDLMWKQFLKTKEVKLKELEAITAAQTSCEKETLAKYSYMTAYYHLCQGDVSTSKDILENRTLRLTEKTSLRVEDVEGLASEVGKMKTLYQDMPKLDVAWQTYMKTGVSPGFDMELPLFPCYPIPTMKELVLKGAVDVCNLGPTMLGKIKELQAKSGVTPNGELGSKIKELEAAVGQNETNLSTLNEAWEAFIPNNKVRHMGKYAYEYCSIEPLIRAYIMDGFAYVCGMGVDRLEEIYSLQESGNIRLEEITMIKIKELAEIIAQYQADGVEIEKIWSKFVAQGDKLISDYQSADFYCDNVHRIEDWTIRGLSGSCEVAHLYLEKIDEFQGNFEFKFFAELECRVQRLRIKVWDCRYQALLKLARIEAPDAYEERLAELMKEYGMGAQPDLCYLDE